ncbi:riboflavin synthase subunit beta [Lacinutrix neustonica]|uniref:Riboflavin synthase subunit beta n=1 Tax=Lacinutrix neustonica TaxID=2980107 RepID=A0A9E8MYM7_9FLAO|nr:riboflavin synthase subunit beta [Lacinutrix neustonica]WAC03295.1 riboflavin synthase subunit beta [Lacinutrix neustonica]
MGIIPHKKNKRYNYTPRYYKGSGDGSPFEMKHKFDDYRSTVGSSGGIKSKFSSALHELRNAPDKSANRRIIIIISVLILLFLFIIDFDLSIFFSKL